MDSINYEQLAQVIQERKEMTPELQNASHQEVISSILHEHRATVAQQQTDTGTQAQGTSGGHAGTQNESNLPEYAKESPQEAKELVENLIGYTLEHGIRAGVEKAVKGDPFVLDLYHDALSEKLYEEMKSRKLL